MKQESKKRPFYQHIASLRGIAILMVVLFHLFPNCFSQGYLGVDVFLVISGYLLFLGLKCNENFNFLEFIQKKVLRIMPPFACMLLLVGLCVIPVLFSSNDIVALGNSMAYSLVGLSNRYYQNLYADYFSAGANMNPLLHTWYLAVILQVYVIWAIGCWAFSKMRDRSLRASAIFLSRGRNMDCKVFFSIIVVFVAIASLIYSHSYQLQSFFSQLGLPTWGAMSEVSYYSTFGRLWQIAAGGLVFFLPLHHKKVVNASLSALGLLLIILTGCCNLSFAPFGAIITVISTILLIRYTPDTPLAHFLDNKILQWVGKISFSLYLVHFPIIVIYKRWEKLQPDLLSGSLLLALAIAIAWLLWYTVEKRKWKLVWTVMIIGLTGAMAIFLRCENVFGAPVSKAFSQFYPIYQDEYLEIPENIYKGYDKSLLVANSGTTTLMYDAVEGRQIVDILPIGECQSPEFVLIGDSNTQHLFAGMNELCKNKSLQGVHLTTIVVPLENRVVHVDDPGYNWDREKAEALYAWLSQHPEIHTVVISNMWSRLFKVNAINWEGKNIETNFSDNADLLKQFCIKLKNMGKQVVLVMPSPRFFNLDKELHGTGLEYVRWLERRHGGTLDITNPNEPLVLTESKYREYYKQVIDLFNSWEGEGFCKVLHIEKPMFKEGVYLGLKNGALKCRDATHITPPASIELMEGVADEFEQIIINGRSN